MCIRDRLRGLKIEQILLKLRVSNLLKILIKPQILEADLVILILKSKRITKIIKNISGLKNIVFDSQI
mgnify:CR=1 FL=1